MSSESTRLPVELIRAKRDGGALTAAELRGFIAGVTDGAIPEIGRAHSELQSR